MTFPAPLTSPAPAKKRGADVIPASWQRAAIVPAAMVAVMVLVRLVDLLPVDLVRYGGIRPRSLDGLVGVLTAPFLHTGWPHLLANAVPFVIFGFLVMVNGLRQFLAVTAVVWLVSGLGVWLVSPANSVVVGASGIVFGWLAYLVVRGVFTRRPAQIALGLILLALWGSMFWGVFPGAAHISWQGHLFGALGGVLAAFLAAKADGSNRRRPPAALPGS